MGMCFCRFLGHAPRDSGPGGRWPTPEETPHPTDPAQGPQGQDSSCCSTHTRDSKAPTDIPQRILFRVEKEGGGWGLRSDVYFVKSQRHTLLRNRSSTLLKKRSVGPFGFDQKLFLSMSHTKTVFGECKAYAKLKGFGV